MTHPDTDFHAWTLETAERVRTRQLTEEDYDWIAEELEDMGKSQRHALRSQLRRLLMHLLKGQSQSEGRREGTSWERTLRSARREIEDWLEDSPSLKLFLEQILEKTYQQAREDAIAETPATADTFPGTFSQTGWTLEQVLDLDFYPGPREPHP